MRYAQGGGLTAEGRGRRELFRLAAVEKFKQRIAVGDIAAELRVSERSVQRWRRAWEAGGAPGLASRGRRPGAGSAVTSGSGCSDARPGPGR
jgi:transposase